MSGGMNTKTFKLLWCCVIENLMPGLEMVERPGVVANALITRGFEAGHDRVAMTAGFGHVGTAVIDVN